jgi:hypothetical protein
MKGGYTMKILVERAEYFEGVVSATLRFGELSISGFEITATNDVVLPDNISCPLEVEEQIRDHLSFFANRFRLQEEAKKKRE